MTLRQMFSPVSLALGAAGIAATAYGFAAIPADRALPVHWGLDGTPDRFLPSPLALLVPVLFIALVWGIFAAVDRWAPESRKAGGRSAARVAIAGLTGLFLVMQVAIVAIGVGLPVDMVRVIAFAVAALLIALGNVMPKTQPNSLAGMRMRSTLADPANWQATHRLTGWLLITGGICLLTAALVVPTGLWLIVSLLAAILLPIAIGAIYSLRFAARRGTP